MKYRVIKKIVNGKEKYIPQVKGWFFWHNIKIMNMNDYGDSWYEVPECDTLEDANEIIEDYELEQKKDN